MPSPHKIARRWMLGAGLVLAAVLVFTSPALADTYWFESYQRAVQMIDAGELDKATPMLEGLMKEMPTPAASARVPGNRFVNYLPYYQMARIQFQRGEFSAAAHNLDVSEAFGAVRNDRQALLDVSTMRIELDRGIARGESVTPTEVAVR